MNLNSTLWNSTASKVSVPLKDFMLGELMSVVDTNTRWIYTGSYNRPPCNKGTYWHVVKKVYPIKQFHLDHYRKILNRA